jgi:thiamine-phosphate pyrophosphorylase
LAEATALDTKLYAITPDGEPGAVEALVTEWLAAGVRLIQLRQTRLPRSELLALARSVTAAVRAAGGAVIVNDQLDIALLAGADGVHLGPDDLSVAAARRVAGADLLIGASAATPDAAREAEQAGADYLGSGPAFATANKTTKPVIGPAGIAGVAAAVTIPVFAIGGISRDRVPELREAGIDRVCAIGALAGGGAAAREFLEALA